MVWRIDEAFVPEGQSLCVSLLQPPARALRELMLVPIKDDSSWLENQGSLLRADVQWPVHSFRFSLPGLPAHIRLTPESAAVSGGGSRHSEIPSWPRHPSQLQGGLLRRLRESWVISARVAIQINSNRTAGRFRCRLHRIHTARRTRTNAQLFTAVHREVHSTG